MHRISTVIAGMLMVSAVALAPAYAQQEVVVTSADIDAALGDRVREAEGDRATIREFLEAPSVTRTMERMGVNAERMHASAELLNDAEARDVADRVRAGSDVLAGGDVLVISTTTIIIALLVLIVILVAD